MTSEDALPSNAASPNATPLDPAALPEWRGKVAESRDLQLRLASLVRVEDDYPATLRTIAGLDVGFEDRGAWTRAAAVLLDAQTLQPIAQAVTRLPTRMPYVPGLLSFRELPALLAVLAMLPEMPDLVMVDGQGIAHPRRLGAAAHFGVASGLPTIGVAKSRLVGDFEEPGPALGDSSPLLHEGERIGSVLRSRARCRPLFVSPGHRVSIDSATALVVRCLAGYRLPEPTRLADRLASRRGPPTPGEVDARAGPASASHSPSGG